MARLYAAPEIWQERFRKDQRARKLLVDGAREHSGSTRRRSRLLPLYDEDGTITLTDHRGLPQPAETICPEPGPPSWYPLLEPPEKTRGVLVTDLRAFHVRACLFLGPLAHMRFPRGCYIVGSTVSILSVAKPSSIPEGVLRETFTEQRLWKLNLWRDLKACVQDEGIVENIYLWARESEVDLADRLQGRRAHYDPLNLEDSGGDLLNADVDIAFCQDTEEEAHAALQSLDYQLRRHFGVLPKLKSNRTLTYFLPYPWRHVQLKLGRRPLLEWLMDADASPTACAMRPGGPLGLCRPNWCLTRGLESIESRVNVLHLKTLLFRPSASERIVKYAQRGFMPLVAGHENLWLWEEEAQAKLSEVGVHCSKSQPGRKARWRPSWSVLHAVLFRGSRENALGSADSEEEREFWDPSESTMGVAWRQHRNAAKAERRRRSRGDHSEATTVPIDSPQLAAFLGGADRIWPATTLCGTFCLAGHVTALKRLYGLFRGAASSVERLEFLFQQILSLSGFCDCDEKFWCTHFARGMQRSATKAPEDLHICDYNGGAVMLRRPGLLPETAAQILKHRRSKLIQVTDVLQEAAAEVTVAAPATQHLAGTWSEHGFL